VNSEGEIRRNMLEEEEEDPHVIDKILIKFEHFHELNKAIKKLSFLFFTSRITSWIIDRNPNMKRETKNITTVYTKSLRVSITQSPRSY
jgi:hypothetical protein